MWEYTGAKDTTRTKSSELSPGELDTRIRAIPSIDRDDSPTLAHTPFSSENPPRKVTFSLSSLLSSLDLIVLYSLFFSDAYVSFIDRIGRLSPAILPVQMLD